MRLAPRLTEALFQSTHPARGATRRHPRHVKEEGISIHAPREGCDWDDKATKDKPIISIHAPREGCDG